MRDVIRLILETDSLKNFAYECGDDDMSIYDLCKEALKWPDEPEEEEEPWAENMLLEIPMEKRFSTRSGVMVEVVMR